MTPQKRSALRTKLRAKVELLDRKKSDAAALGRDIKLVQTQVLDLLDEAGLSTFSYEDEAAGLRVKATRVQAVRLVFDQPKLKKALGAKLWKKVTTAFLDESKLESAVAEGLIDPMLLAENSEEKKNEPYVKVSTSLAKNGDEPQTSVSDVPVEDRPGRKRRGVAK